VDSCAGYPSSTVHLSRGRYRATLYEASFTISRPLLDLIHSDRPMEPFRFRLGATLNVFWATVTIAPPRTHIAARQGTTTLFQAEQREGHGKQRRDGRPADLGAQTIGHKSQLEAWERRTAPALTVVAALSRGLLVVEAAIDIDSWRRLRDVGTVRR
jgi:hypothetical protein